LVHTLLRSKIKRRVCRLGGYKLSDWTLAAMISYVRKLNDACVGSNDYTHAKLYHTVQEYYS